MSTASDDVPPGNVDVAGSAYDPASLTVLDIACESSTSSVVAPRSIDASVDTRWPGSAVVGPRLFEPATSVFAGAPTVAANPGSLDVASSRTRVRSDTPMPMSDVGQRMRVDVPRPLDLTAYCW